MPVGSIVIAGELIGFVVGNDKNMCRIKGESGKIYTVKRSACTEVVSAQALAALLYAKLVKRVNNEKSQNRG